MSNMIVLRLFLVICTFKIVKSCVSGDSKVFCNTWDTLKDGDFSKYKSLYIHIVEMRHQILNKQFFDSKLNHLDSIHLNGGNFTLEKNVFKGLEKLRSIDISYVYSKFVVTEGIYDNTGIEDIFLYNSIIDLKPNAFKNMTKARQIWIGSNNLPTIKNDVFTNTIFKMIYLSDNQIENIEKGAFLGMQNLGYLDLSKNHLKTLDTEAILGKTISLEILDIAENKLSEITIDMMKNLPNLEVFNASSNSIKVLENSCFKSEQLWLIDLSNNSISLLPEKLLPTKNKLENIYLHENDLQFLSPKLLPQFSNLKEISLSGNLWKCSCFAGVKSWMEKQLIEDVCGTGDCIAGDKECLYKLEDIIPLEEKPTCYIPDWRSFVKKRETKGKEGNNGTEPGF